MLHEPFHIYTIKVGLPKDQSNKQSKIEAKIQDKYPGMKIEFSEAKTLEPIEVSINLNVLSDAQIAGVSALTSQLQDLVESFRSTN